MNEASFMNWYWNEATSQEKQLHDRMYDFEEFFEDMLFAEGSASYDLIKCQSKVDGEWVDDEAPRPDELQFFSYSWFKTKVAQIGDGNSIGQYDKKDQVITVDPQYVDNDANLLHEMIHLHEYVINDLPLYYHDMLLWALYRDLIKKIPRLDEAIDEHAHILNESSLYARGGLHDILFLLKSFDLDIRIGKPLGTVFGYGMVQKLESFKYFAVACDSDFAKVTPAEAAELEAAEAEIAHGETVSESEIDWDAE